MIALIAAALPAAVAAAIVWVTVRDRRRQADRLRRLFEPGVDITPERDAVLDELLRLVRGGEAS